MTAYSFPAGLQTDESLKEAIRVCDVVASALGIDRFNVLPLRVIINGDIHLTGQVVVYVSPDDALRLAVEGNANFPA